MADVKWIKITVDMFDNRKIKHLRKLPDGNNIVLIWVMLLTMAGRCNAGGMIFLTENIPYTPKMLADELNFEETTVQLALQALEQFNMITTDGNCFRIAGWNEHQNVEGLDKIREQNRLRQKKWYENQKALPEGKPNVRSNVIITQPNATEGELEEESEEEKKNKEIYKTIVAFLNEKAGTNFRPSTKSTRDKIHARLKEGFTLDDFKTVIEKKCNEWLDDPKMCKFLRPETLFGPKFEGYLNEKTRKAGSHGSTEEPDTSTGRYGIWL